jgi:hypothetical protein
MDDLDFVIVHSYGLDQAIADGLLAPVFVDRLAEISGGKPIVMTAAIAGEFSLAAIQEIWNTYVPWRQDVMPQLPEEEQMFSTTMNNRTVWVIEDGSAFTVLFPEDY